MIVMLERGESLVIGDWGKGWEIQVQPVAVQSKPKRMQDAGRRCGNEEPLYPSHWTPVGKVQRMSKAWPHQEGLLDKAP